MTVQERFDSKYIKDETGCWIWQACTNSSGYGGITVNGKWSGAHRVSWELKYGQIPKGLCVCHTCDVPSCVNPEHLFLGSASDNMKDAVIKKRQNYSKKTKCKNGHILKNNSYARTDCVVFGRACKTCKRLNKARWRAKRKLNG